MNLLKNRPLALFCVIFIFISTVIYSFSANATIALACVFLACVAVCVILSVLLKNKRIGWCAAALCFTFAFLAAFSQWAFADIRREQALELVGENKVKFTVISSGYSSGRSSEYAVRISEVGDERVSEMSVAVLAFEAEYEIGDELYANAVIYPRGSEVLGFSRDLDEDVYIQLAVYETNDIILLSEDNKSFETVFSKWRETVSDYMTGIFGEDTASLAAALLLGDKSELSTETVRDFRRAGVSHLLAVSGLHTSILIGAIELFLRVLYVPKKLRCVLLSLSAVFLLAMTGFSMSACRSVIMLMCVYFCYLFVKENDAVTSLLFSVSLIMFIFPHSVRDIGLWMSFLATLGIVAVYVPLSACSKKPPKKGAIGIAQRFFRKIGFAILLTFICNAFICFIAWAVFGEMSVISLLSNLILAPLCEGFMLTAPLSAVLGGVPLIGGALIKALRLLGVVTVSSCKAFSRIGGAVISLKYPFAGLIICLMSLALLILLLVKLKRKWLILLPPLSACLAFVLCFGGYALIHKGEASVSCFAEGNNEMLVISEGYSAAVCDFSSGAYSFLRQAPQIASDDMATEISEYVLTHYHGRQSSSLDRLFRDTLVRKIYLPYPETREEYVIMADIIECAEEQGVEAEIYGYGSALSVLGEKRLYVFSSKNAFGGSHSAISAVIDNRGELLSYVNVASKRTESLDELINNSEYVIFGEHGVHSKEKFEFGGNTDSIKGFYYTTPQTLVYSRVSHAIEKVHILTEKKSIFRLVLG